MLASPAIRSNIRKGETHLLYSTIQTSRQSGMQTMNQSLRELVQNRRISKDSALEFSYNPDELRQLLGMSINNQNNVNASDKSFR